MVGLSWGGGTQLGGTRKRRGAGTLVLTAVCAAGSEAGGEQRKAVSLQSSKAVRKQRPSSEDLISGPLGPPRGGSGPE